MKKIKTLFVRDHTTKLVTPEPTPGTEAVFEGRCRPTFKWDGTYELVGPKVQGNPHGFTGVHALLLHGGVGFIETVPLTFDELREFMEKSVIEGVIWWDDNGPVAKLKRRDFGFPWP